ncbi:MAG: DUF1592 domain-containing protein, partial [Planctomycetaceae bacterium]|nr:DUF1592 domain-containing protein [Planctomycetaceae bacterium]
AVADEREAETDTDFAEHVQPLLLKYCRDCHSDSVTEADIDLAKFQTADEMRREIGVWIRVRGMLDSHQMPPKDSEQPTDDEKAVLQQWVRRFLRREAEATAGDPGPVVLRRLNNEEYNYTVRDLTGVVELNPTSEFPVDGAAGEGFINTGAAQSMSPSMVTKYLDAAKDVASHAVLLPGGIEFSAGISRREWTDERLQDVRRFYDRFTVPREVLVEVGGTGKVDNQGGTIPYDRYFTATIEERTALLSGDKTTSDVANERSLNPKYLNTLFGALTRATADNNPWLHDLRQRWQMSTAAGVVELADQLPEVRQKLWKFNTIGQLTEGAQQKVWMEPVSTVITRQDIRVPLPAAHEHSNVILYLSMNDLGDGSEQDNVLWQQPRIEFPASAAGAPHPPILLRDLPGLAARTREFVRNETPRTADYLTAVAKHHLQNTPLEQLAGAGGLHPELLSRWAELVGLGTHDQRKIVGHFTGRVTQAQGYTAVNGWGVPQTPSMLTNRSEEDISFLTLTVPARSVVMHPSPTQESVAAWRSPIEGSVHASGLVADADDKCGNGAAWRLELRTESGTSVLAEGAFDNGGRGEFQPDGEFKVRSGDVVALIVNARDGSHACDTTHVALTLTEAGGDQRRWDMAADVVDRILESNPLPDSYGHADVWHFCAADNQPTSQSPLIAGSSLEKWRDAVVNSASFEQLQTFANDVRAVMTTDDVSGLTDADRSLRQQLSDWTGPLRWAATTNDAGKQSDGNKESAVSGDVPLEFGRHPNGSPIDPTAFCLKAPQVAEVRIPAELSAAAEFAAAVELHGESGAGGSVQVQVLTARPERPMFSPAEPVLTGTDPAAGERLEAALAEYRNLFPPAVCYTRIVPVDEVVTMVLYFREDEHLQRLMLNGEQTAELNRLWDELLYVAQEPIALTVAFEQIYEFATQDRPDLVVAFAPFRQPINDRADVFRTRLRETEPVHLQAVIEFADRAWRRPLAESEQLGLRKFYAHLRSAEVAHEDALRLTLARLLTSPDFLYRRELPPESAETQPVPTTATPQESAGSTSAVPVSNDALATRLSYFLWSSLPDAELRRATAAGIPVTDEVLLQQTKRMLQDARTRRLAIQFACQWLHLRDFDRNDDKNENLYPEFAGLRSDMYEETVRFFEDLFRNNGSVLDLVNADHAFLNETLAQHYGIDGVRGEEWRRVEGIRSHGRGGVMGMASLLAAQSGASRTSPILRGNWVFETLLGERLPRPPAGVPQLPEMVPEGQTARQLIELHSSVPECAKCHEKIDPYGFALEQFDTIGRLRPAKVDTQTTLSDGHQIDGLDGMQHYLLTVRRDDILRQFCRKLLGFSLGREIQLSDELLLDKMLNTLTTEEFRFHAVINNIVLSDQFRKVRTAVAPAE